MSLQVENSFLLPFVAFVLYIFVSFVLTKTFIANTVTVALILITLLLIAYISAFIFYITFTL